MPEQIARVNFTAGTGQRMFRDNYQLLLDNTDQHNDSEKNNLVVFVFEGGSKAVHFHYNIRK